MVGFVDDSVVVETAPHLFPEPAGGEHADGAEQVLQAGGFVGADLQFAEILVPQDIAKGTERLLENLLPVGHEEQPRLPLTLVIEALEVEGCHHGLAGTGGGDNQVAPAVVGGALPP